MKYFMYFITLIILLYSNIIPNTNASISETLLSQNCSGNESTCEHKIYFQNPIGLFNYDGKNVFSGSMSNGSAYEAVQYNIDTGEKISSLPVSGNLTSNKIDNFKLIYDGTYSYGRKYKLYYNTTLLDSSVVNIWKRADLGYLYILKTDGKLLVRAMDGNLISGDAYNFGNVSTGGGILGDYITILDANLQLHIYDYSYNEKTIPTPIKFNTEFKYFQGSPLQKINGGYITINGDKLIMIDENFNIVNTNIELLYNSTNTVESFLVNNDKIYIQQPTDGFPKLSVIDDYVNFEKEYCYIKDRPIGGDYIDLPELNVSTALIDTINYMYETDNTNIKGSSYIAYSENYADSYEFSYNSSSRYFKVIQTVYDPVVSHMGFFINIKNLPGGYTSFHLEFNNPEISPELCKWDTQKNISVDCINLKDGTNYLFGYTRNFIKIKRDGFNTTDGVPGYFNFKPVKKQLYIYEDNTCFKTLDNLDNYTIEQLKTYIEDNNIEPYIKDSNLNEEKTTDLTVYDIGTKRINELPLGFCRSMKESGSIYTIGFLYPICEFIDGNLPFVELIDFSYNTYGGTDLNGCGGDTDLSCQEGVPLQYYSWDKTEGGGLTGNLKNFYYKPINSFQEGSIPKIITEGGKEYISYFGGTIKLEKSQNYDAVTYFIIFMFVFFYLLGCIIILIVLLLPAILIIYLAYIARNFILFGNVFKNGDYGSLGIIGIAYIIAVLTAVYAILNIFLGYFTQIGVIYSEAKDLLGITIGNLYANVFPYTGFTFHDIIETISVAFLTLIFLYAGLTIVKSIQLKL